MKYTFRCIYPVLFWYVLLFPAAVQAQDSTGTPEWDLEKITDRLADSDSSIDPEEWLSRLEYLRTHPIDLNSATLDALLVLPGLNLVKARAIIAYRINNPPFRSVQDLLKVKGVGPVTLQKIRPYVTVNVQRNGRETRLFEGGRYETITRYRKTIQEREGYHLVPENGGYLGGPAAIYHRSRYASDHLSVTLLQEKDPGEKGENILQTDHLSGNIAVQNIGLLRSAVAGDYRLSFGQGVLFGDGTSFGKGGTEPGSGIAGSERGVRGYGSARETGYFRGGAVTAGRSFRVTGFYSQIARDASVVDEQKIRKPGGSGLHRTMTELERRNQVHERTTGGRIRVQTSFGLLGVTAYRTSFDRSITTDGAVYQLHDFKGRVNRAASFDYQVPVGTGLLFGESAVSGNGAIGMIHGVEWATGSSGSATVAYRNYDPGFYSLFGQAFGEGSGIPGNERGVYLGYHRKLGSRITIGAYFDQYQFPAPRFGTHQATAGREWLAYTELELSPQLSLRLKSKFETREDEYSAYDQWGREVRLLDDEIRWSSRAQMVVRVTRNIRIRLRGERVWVRPAGPANPKEVGVLIYQDLRLIPSDRLTLDARVTVFDTDSFTSRVYQYENDLLYYFSVPALFNHGQRMYLLAKWQPFPVVECWGKFGVTLYEDLQQLGSGLERIEGNVRSEFGLQVRIRI